MNIKPDLPKPGLFRDRSEAGRLLAAKLTAYANRPDVLVLGLPRGGVPVAYEVAQALGAPLDVFVVRKLGVPGYEELAMGAVATGGVRVLNDQLVRRLGIPGALIDTVASQERQELARRERLYREGRPPPDVRGRTVILVDDGLATGATMHAAIEALRQLQPARIVVAVPTASPEACEEMRAKVDDVICAITPEPLDAVEALTDFRRFPTWMWRNTVVVEFIEWLRAHNDALPPGAAKVGFYGLDLYSLHTSMKAVLRYLEKVDSEAAKRARERYSCFDHFGEDTQVYGFMTRLNLAKSCEDEVISQLVELQRRAADHARRGAVEDELFYAEQNARLVKNAEAYYRAMFLEEVSSWNLRDRHMAETLDALIMHLGRNDGRARIAVWEHNSHLGDARATDMRQRSELNVGQLTREKYGHDAVLIGFTTHHGTVTAASDWGAPAERKRVRPALAGSYEALFHAAERVRFLLTWRDNDTLAVGLREPRLERAIGVIYRPETERQIHYFRARVPDQFGAVLPYDETRAVKPLEFTNESEAG